MSGQLHRSLTNSNRQMISKNANFLIFQSNKNHKYNNSTERKRAPRARNFQNNFTINKTKFKSTESPLSKIISAVSYKFRLPVHIKSASQSNYEFLISEFRWWKRTDLGKWWMTQAIMVIEIKTWRLGFTRWKKLVRG